MDENNKNLVWIEKPTIDKEGNSNAFDIGVKVWNMYNSDFNLTIAEICSILQCERNWVVNNVRDNVKHIFLNNKFRIFLESIDNKNNLNSFNHGVYLKDYYYFSRNDFNRWLVENTKITRQTIKVNILNYSDSPGEIVKLDQEFDVRNASIEEIRAYNKKIYSLLNSDGKLIFDNKVNLKKRKVVFIDVTHAEELPFKFTSIKFLKGTQSLELAYRDLYKHGALKYTIMDSLVRYDVDYHKKDHSENNKYIPYYITIPYNIYLDFLKS